jgi:hypothetical protein
MPDEQSDDQIYWDGTIQLVTKDLAEFKTEDVTEVKPEAVTRYMEEHREFWATSEEYGIYKITVNPSLVVFAFYAV